MSDATIRQRRNLMLTTITLILIFHTGMAFGQKLTLFGASITISNPEMLLNFLLIGHVYFAWRFYQYFYMDGAYIALKNQFSKELSDKLDRILMNYIIKSLPKGLTTINGGFTYEQVSRTGVSDNCYEVRVDFPQISHRENSSELVKVPTKIFRYKRFYIGVKFLFRGKILSDFYLPFLLAIYAIVINIYKIYI